MTIISEHSIKRIKDYRQKRKQLLTVALLLIIGCGGIAVYLLSARTPLLYAGMDAADKPLRLHILANSDSAADQQLKLELRDHIISYVEELTVGCESKEAAMSALSHALPELSSECSSFIGSRSGDTVRVTLQRDDFPAIDYAGTVFAAGEYDALRIVIGAGAGHNWWCVLFPPLCFVDLATELDEEAAIPAISGGKPQSAHFRTELKLLRNLRGKH